MRLCGDRTLGRLVKWLRILGIPCELVSYRHPDEIPAESLLLTRNRRLLSEKTLLVPYDRVEDQLRFVFEKLPELRRLEAPFRLCIRCNEPLEEVSREEVFGLVPDFVYETKERFRRCPSCGRVYWRGTHPSRMLSKLKQLGLLRAGIEVDG
ncbi:MAG: hypothetical protein GXO17_04270 [Thermodesulfobacteria bacterium]|nr:hypothetical protein [Thermodesulfobacteriota bacterium]